MSIYVITDDLTGANDTAVQFAKEGLRTFVFIEPASALKIKGQLEVVVLNTESRALPAPIAVERVRSAFHSLSLSESDILFKKIDSTLRGNVVSEVEEVLKLSKKEIAIVAPAYPKNGRTTVNGIHYVRGIPVGETEAATDPRCPVKHSHIPTLFQIQGSLPTASIPLEQVRMATLRDRISTVSQEGKRILIFDSVGEEDLQKIVREVVSSGRKSLWVGSAGLAEAIAEQYQSISTFPAPTALSPVPKPALIILGSMSEVSTQQGEVFAHWAGINPHILDPKETLKRNSNVKERILGLIYTQLRKGQHTLLMTHRQKLEPSSNGSSSLIETLLQTFKALGDSLDFSLCAGLIVTGGDIAMAICEGMGVHSIEVLDETSPGIPLGLVRGGRWEGLPLVTKAGAFGAPDAFIHAVRRISTISGKEQG